MRTRPANGALAVTWLQVTPSIDCQTSFKKDLPSVPPITHNSSPWPALNTKLACPHRGPKGVLTEAWFQFNPSVEYKTSDITLPEARPPMTHKRLFITVEDWK